MTELLTVERQSQRTLRHAIGCVGVGRFSGTRVALTLHPAPADHGIAFRRADRPGAPLLPARLDHVVDSSRSVAIGLAGGPRVAMIEHLLAALAGCGIDNAVAEVGGPEVPAMDGSARPFVFLIECAGVVEQDAPRPVLEVLRRVEVADEGGRAALEPADGLILDCRIDHGHPLIGRQERRHRFLPETFKGEIAAARTFALADSAEELASGGLEPGASLKNTLVLGGERILNEEGARFPDEPARHRILDALGDLQLVGAQVVGRYAGQDAGHALNLRLLRELLADPTAWRWAAGTEPHRSQPPQAIAAYG
jgi:UDP-3-O-[3-hydroxymyristoyl] N-acetylglucosamine deacetylase